MLGVPVKVISEMLGHSASRITEDVYIHVQAEAQKDIADKMKKLFWD